MSLAPHLDPTVVELGRRALLDLGEVSTSLVYGSFLTDDGFEIVHEPDGVTDANRFAGMASSIQALSEAVAREVRIGAGEYVIVAAERGPGETADAYHPVRGDLAHPALSYPPPASSPTTAS